MDDEFGMMDEQAIFIGRSRELDEIASFVQSDQSVSVVGPRQIGKTALLKALSQPASLSRAGFGDHELLTYIDGATLADGTHNDLYGRLAAALAATLRDRQLPPEPAVDAAAARATRLAFESGVRRLNQRGLRVVLLIDDFDQLSANPRIDLLFFNALRSAAARYQLVFVTASTRPLIDLTYTDRSEDILASPFFNIFAQVPLGLLPEDEARPLIRALIDAGVYSRAIEDFVYDLAGGHPLVIHAASGYARARQDALEIERQTLQQLESHFGRIWQSLVPEARAVLQQAAAGARPIDGRQQVLRDLAQHCLVTLDGEAYRLPFRAWSSFVATRGDGPAGDGPNSSI